MSSILILLLLLLISGSRSVSQSIQSGGGSESHQKQSTSQSLSSSSPPPSPAAAGDSAALLLSSISCRTELGFRMNFPEYLLHTCARCYDIIPLEAFKPNGKLGYLGYGMLYDLERNVTVFANETEVLSHTFLTESMAQKWRECCNDASVCCTQHLRHENSNVEEDRSSSQNPDSLILNPIQSRDKRAPENQLGMEREEWSTKLQDSSPSSPQDSSLRGSDSLVSDSFSPFSDSGVRRTMMMMMGDEYLITTSSSSIRTADGSVIEAARIPYKPSHLSASASSSLESGSALDMTGNEEEEEEGKRLQHTSPSASVREIRVLHCPRTWDGWSCWKDNVAVGITVEQPCPDHIYWKIDAPACKGFVTKTCTPRGWLSLDGREWSNYTNCARDDIYVRRLRYSIITNLISVSFIIPALVIFNSYRQLSKSPRIRLHKHLFTSLLLYAILSSLLKINLLSRRGRGSLEEEGTSASTDWIDVYCLTLSLLLRYFRSTTYICMFNEAFYLHQLIRKAFHAPKILPLILISYGVPAAMAGTYIACRALIGGSVPVPLTSIKEGIGVSSASSIGTAEPLIAESIPPSDDPCWMLPAQSAWMEWIINGPNLCMLLANSFLIIPIVREIYRKASSLQFPSSVSPSIHKASVAEERRLTSNGSQREQHQRLVHDRNSVTTASKASFIVSLRAATLLLPLYGLHYLIIVYRPDFDVCWLSELYHYSSLTLDGLQGLLVSILFCFGNNEVRSLLKRTLFGRRDPNLCLTEVVPVVRNNTLGTHDASKPVSEERQHLENMSRH